MGILHTAAVVSKLPTDKPKTILLSAETKTLFAYGNKNIIPQIIDDDWFCNDRGSYLRNMKIFTDLQKQNERLRDTGDRRARWQQIVACTIRVCSIKRWKWHYWHSPTVYLCWDMRFIRISLGQLTYCQMTLFCVALMLYIWEIIFFQTWLSIDLIILSYGLKTSGATLPGLTLSATLSMTIATSRSPCFS